MDRGEAGEASGRYRMSPVSLSHSPMPGAGRPASHSISRTCFRAVCLCLNQNGRAVCLRVYVMCLAEGRERVSHIYIHTHIHTYTHTYTYPLTCYLARASPPWPCLDGACVFVCVCVGVFIDCPAKQEKGRGTCFLCVLFLFCFLCSFWWFFSRAPFSWH